LKTEALFNSVIIICWRLTTSRVQQIKRANNATSVIIMIEQRSHGSYSICVMWATAAACMAVCWCAVGFRSRVWRIM